MTASASPQHDERPPVQQTPPVRLTSHDLLQQARAIEIEHDGKIYELRLTRLNKLILTA